MEHPLDRVNASMYVSEVRELAAALSFRLDEIQKASAEWLKHDQIATEQARSDPEQFDVSRFNEALSNSGYQQSVIVDDFEALFAAWARLSLLFVPIAGMGEEGEWRERRGNMLRELLAVPISSLLGKRAFRDSWMHFDERMDQAALAGRLGNPHQFVRAAGVSTAVQRSVRVIDVEGLVFHYRTKTGTPENVRLATIRQTLEGLKKEMASVGARIMRLPARA